MPENDENTRKEVLEYLLKNIQDGTPFIIIGLRSEELSKKVSIAGVVGSYEAEHKGDGFFAGETKNGEFSFDGGGAMVSPKLPKGDELTYSTVRASPEVIKELGYPFKEVEGALIMELAML